MNFYKIMIRKYLVYFIFCFSFFNVFYCFAIFESSLEIGGSLLHMKPVEKEEIPQFLENYVVYLAKQVVEAGWFSNEGKAIESVLFEEERQLLEALKDPLLNETFYDNWKNENLIFYIYLNDESIPCGYFWCDLGTPEEKSRWIQWIFIEANYRRMGIGTAILNAFAEESKALGFKDIFLHVFTHNTHAYHLYKKLGYVELAPAEFGISSCYMVKKLNN